MSEFPNYDVFLNMKIVLSLQTVTVQMLKKCYIMRHFIWVFTGLPFIEQEMSQTRDECPQTNWSSIRHICEKLAVI